MTEERSALIPAARSLLKLARRDPRAAAAALADLSHEEQAAAICESPLELRRAMLDLLPIPEAVIPLLPEAELCFTCKYVGVHDASWILAQATDRQIVACFDLDAWSGLVPDRARLVDWFATLAEAGDETLLRAAQSLDPEIVALYLRDRAQIVLKPSGDEDWEPPDGSQTLEGQFYIVARSASDDLEPLLRLAHTLFTNDYWLYFRMMQSVAEELEPELEEWALRWRTGRLEDLGFPSWDTSMRIYGFLRPERLDDLPRDVRPLEVEGWALPVWVTELPVPSEGGHSIFRAVAQLELEERRAFFYAFIALANKVAVADRCDLGDAETLPATIEKAAGLSSLGLDHLAKVHALEPVEILRQAPLERLFRVGVNLSPEEVRPSFSDQSTEDA